MFVLIELKTAVIVGLVGGSINIDGFLGRRDILLLSAGSGEVMGQDGGLLTVAVEDVVLGAVNVVVVLDSLDVSDGFDVRTSVSTVDLLVIVDRRVRGDNRDSFGLLRSNTVGAGLMKLSVIVLVRRDVGWRSCRGEKIAK